MKKPGYVTKLKARRNFLVTKAVKDNKDAYASLSKSLEKEYNDFSRNMDAKYASAIEAKQKKLDEKMASVSESIEYVRSCQKVKHTLDDGVLLSVRGLKMYFGGLKAVDDLSFDVKKGEIFGLIGPNGAGKTTVFNCITRFYDATGGDMYFENKYGEVVDMRDFKVHDVILQGISRTFQNIELVKEVSVLDNLLIAATRYYGSSLFTQTLHLPFLKKEERAMTAKAEKVLKYMDLYSYRDRLCWGLPYGILKRVEIARALMSNPKLIILDEPAAGLNEAETAELATLIDKIRRDFDCTILLVEHDMSLVMKICDHICAISFGRKLAYGTPKEIQASKEVQEAYLGSGGDE
jgi:branched-chain amino acid transport system ATP-binding protein